MKKFFLFTFLFFAITIISFGQKRETRNVGSFDVIKAGGSFNVTIEKGTKEKVVIEAEEGPIDKIITEVSGGALKIYIENNSWKNYQYRNVKIHVTFVKLNEVHGSGSGNTYIKSDINGSELVISSSGSGNLYCEAPLTSKNDARLNNSGSGNLHISSGVKVNGEVSINNSGSGNMKIDRLVSSDININNSGSGDLSVDSGETTYQKIVMSGSGNVKMGGLRSQDCQISKSGSGSAYIHVEDELSGDSSGSGNIYLTRSSVRLDVRTSGSGKVKTLN